ncbi:MAG: hypothetical protein ACYTF7_11900 [Planctomycetota bacterium]
MAPLCGYAGHPFGTRCRDVGRWTVYACPGWEGEYSDRLPINAIDGDTDEQLFDEIDVAWSGNPDIDAAIWDHVVTRWCAENLGAGR